MINFKYISFIPFDVSTLEGREQERYRLAHLAIVTNILSRAASIAVMVLTVTLTIPYLGEQRFGLWMTIASFVSMLTFLDIGVGNALTNRVAITAVNNNEQLLKRTITGGLGLLLIISVIAIVILIPIVAFMPWDNLLKTTDHSLHAEKINTLYIFIMLFGLNMFATGVQRIFVGLQLSYEAHLFSIIGTIISLLMIFIAAYFKCKIPILLICSMSGTIITGIILLGILKKRNLIEIKNLSNTIRYESQFLIKASGLFFLLQIGTMIGWGIDSLLISGVIGVNAVASFALTQRIFQIVTQPMAIINAPLWAAYADACARKEINFIKKTLVLSLRNTFLYTIIASSLIILFGEKIIIAWTSGNVHTEIKLIIAFGVWVIIEALGNALAMFMNGCNIIKPQVIAVLLIVVISLPAKLYLLNQYGVASMLFGFTIIFTSIILFLYRIIYFNKIKESLFM